MPWKLRILSDMSTEGGGAPEFVLLPQKFSNVIAEDYAPVPYYPETVLFRKFVEIGKFEAKDGLAATTLQVSHGCLQQPRSLWIIPTAKLMEARLIQLGVEGLEGGMAKLELVEWGEQGEGAALTVLRARKSCLVAALPVASAGRNKVLVQVSPGLQPRSLWVIPTAAVS